MTTYVNHGSTVTVHSDSDISVTKNLPAGNYVVAVDPGGNFILKTTQEFEPSKKIYGDVLTRTERVLNTFHERERSTGVLLQGSPGCGKTLLARNICMKAKEQNIPTIIINESFTGDKFSTFIASIDQPCVLMFDEFEKVYDREDQNGVLTLFDGVFTQKKLFLVTVNDPYALIDPFLNRPGRLYYSFAYSGLSQDFIEEFVNENLENKANIGDVISMCRGVYKNISFDGLSSAISEMNRYNETFSQVVNILNISPGATDSIDVSVTSSTGRLLKYIRSNITDLYTDTEMGIQVQDLKGRETNWLYLDPETDLVGSDLVTGAFTFKVPSSFSKPDDAPDDYEETITLVIKSSAKKPSSLMDLF